MRQQNISIFYEGQDDLIDILAVSMASVCYNTKSFIDFYILDCGICNFNKKQLALLKEKFTNCSIEFIPIDLTQFKHLAPWCGKYWDCYSRLLIPELKKDIDKAIYLDSDVIALDDILALWQEPMDGFAYAAAADIGYEKLFFENCINNLNVSAKHIYANAGVLLIDCKKWRKDKICDKLFQIADKYKQHIYIICEDILSIYSSENKYKLLPSRYNLTDRDNCIKSTVAPEITDEYIEKEWQHIILQHLSPGKAWKKAYNQDTYRELKHFDSFWFFAEKTPFYAGLQKKFDYYNSLDALKLNQIAQENRNIVSKMRILGFPLLTKYEYKKKIKYKLFNKITVITVKDK